MAQGGRGGGAPGKGNPGGNRGGNRGGGKEAKPSGSGPRNSQQSHGKDPHRDQPGGG
ncbi:hypothetical protein ACFODL_14060 [Phenylobacterium terrae]|uniref:Pseudouridine synthase n=1 Tax=Phenylobacterium terrae TaxID=2665495 RepID=A0ABW4N0J8_9CAUL